MAQVAVLGVLLHLERAELQHHNLKGLNSAHCCGGERIHLQMRCVGHYLGTTSKFAVAAIAHFQFLHVTNKEISASSVVNSGLRKEFALWKGAGH